MHELSLAWEVIELTKREAEKNKVTIVREIEIEVGDLSGVEADAFLSALELITRDTILEAAEIRIKRTSGIGFCTVCNQNFQVTHRMETCPGCGNYASKVSGGEVFRVLSMLAD